MRTLYATLHTLGLTLADRLHDLPGMAGPERERGASTVETVFWAVGLLALAGIVYAVLSGWIDGKLAGLS